MHVTLVLPNLVDIGADSLAAVEAPALARLLSASADPVIVSGGTLGVACAGVGIVEQEDWPVAPWLARAAGIDPGRRYWLCAEPMTVELERGEGRLAGGVGDLDAAESAALLSHLGAHFAPDGIEFAACGSGRWLVSIAANQRLVTAPPAAVVGRPIASQLPHGEDSARWRRWQSEMQMLLFEHAVNRNREREGRAPVNYVWLWGGGVLDDSVLEARANVIFTRMQLLRELARATGSDAEDPPASFEQLRESPVARALVWFDDLSPQAIVADLAAFDAQWARPLGRALDGGEISATLVVGAAQALCFEPRPARPMQRLLRRWSQPPRLAHLVAPLNDG